MSFADNIYRCGSLCSHFLRATNTFGHGIHSPYLYNLVRFVIYDDNQYYCFSDIEKERKCLLRAKKEIYVEDFGTGVSGRRTVSAIAASSLMPAGDAQLIFRIVNELKPSVVVELGTSLGITTSYLSYATGKGRVFTFEGSRSLTVEAQKVWTKLGCDNITTAQGNIDTTLKDFLRDIPTLDFALVDANHTYQATKDYFDLLADHCCEKSVIVFDDIRYSRQMAKAWTEIVEDKRVTASIDLYDMGIVFFNKQLLPKKYKMRV